MKVKVKRSSCDQLVEHYKNSYWARRGAIESLYLESTHLEVWKIYKNRQETHARPPERAPPAAHLRGARGQARGAAHSGRERRHRLTAMLLSPRFCRLVTRAACILAPCLLCREMTPLMRTPFWNCLDPAMV